MIILFHENILRYTGEINLHERITTSLAGKGYLKEIRKSLSLGLFNIARQRYQDKGLAQYDTVKSSCSLARNEVIEELQPVYIGNEIVGWVKLTVPGI